MPSPVQEGEQQKCCCGQSVRTAQGVQHALTAGGAVAGAETVSICTVAAAVIIPPPTAPAAMKGPPSAASAAATPEPDPDSAAARAIGSAEAMAATGSSCAPSSGAQLSMPVASVITNFLLYALRSVRCSNAHLQGESQAVSRRRGQSSPDRMETHLQRHMLELCRPCVLVQVD